MTLSHTEWQQPTAHLICATDWLDLIKTGCFKPTEPCWGTAEYVSVSVQQISLTIVLLLWAGKISSFLRASPKAVQPFVWDKLHWSWSCTFVLGENECQISAIVLCFFSISLSRLKSALCLTRGCKSPKLAGIYTGSPSKRFRVLYLKQIKIRRRKDKCKKDKNKVDVCLEKPMRNSSIYCLSLSGQEAFL